MSELPPPYPAPGSPTWYFNLHWTNDYSLYHAVLDYSRGLLRRVPSMTDQTLGRNVRDAVQRWCEDGVAEPLGWQDRAYTIKPAVLEMMRREVEDFNRVSEEAVGAEVRELLGEEAGGEW